MLQDLVADRVHQVGLAEPGTAVDEQRVVGGFTRLIGNLPGRCPGKVVGLADHQVVER
jgi:hypothetical protein